MKLRLALPVLLAAGCAGVSYVAENYSGVPRAQHVHQERTYLIFDKPAENRMLVFPGWGDSVAGGLTGGLAGPGSEVAFRAAAADFLDAQGRTCRVTDGAEVLENQYEIYYTCN